MSDFLKNLKLDDWYMILVIVGALGFISSLTIPIIAISNKQTMVLSLGMRARAGYEYTTTGYGYNSARCNFFPLRINLYFRLLYIQREP